MDTKASFMASLKAGSLKYESLDREEIKVTMFGDTALVTCKATVRLMSKGQPVTLVMRLLHVYVKEKGRWQMVAHQSTRLNP